MAAATEPVLEAFEMVRRLEQVRQTLAEAIALCKAADVYVGRKKGDLDLTYHDYALAIQQYLDEASLKAADAALMLDATDSTHPNINFAYKHVIKPGHALLDSFAFDATGKTITASDGTAFSQLAVDDVIAVHNTNKSGNNGIHTITTAAAGVITMSGSTLTDDSADTTAIITLLYRDIP